MDVEEEFVPNLASMLEVSLVEGAHTLLSEGEARSKSWDLMPSQPLCWWFKSRLLRCVVRGVVPYTSASCGAFFVKVEPWRWRHLEL